MIYTWEEVCNKQKEGKFSCLPFGNYKDSKFELREVELKDIDKKYYGTISYYKRHGDDESVHIINRLIGLIENNIELSPVILNSKLGVIDGSHRLSSYRMKRIKKILCFVEIK